MNDDYKTLRNLFLGLCLLKKGPKDLPESKALLQMAGFIYFISGTILISTDAPLVDALAQAFIEALLVALFVYGLTQFFSVPHRFTQAITAIYGSGAIITALSLPSAFLLQLQATNAEAARFSGLILLLIVCWSFVVMAHIIRETIQKNLATSLLLTFCYLYLSYQVINVLYPIEAL